MQQIISIAIILFNLLFCDFVYSAATLSIENSVAPNSSLTTDDFIDLSITVDDMNDSTLDLSSLKPNFEVISQSQQVYHSIINNKSSSKIQWLITLQPKTTGVLTISGIKVGNQTTNSAQIEIKNSSNDPNKTKEIFIDVETDNQELYAKTPLSILVNIYVSTNVTPRNMQLDMPEHENYKLFKISENNKQTFYKNTRYHLYQVKYLVFYNAPGKLKLPKFSLSGLKLKNNTKQNDIFSLYQQQWQPFSRSSVELEVNILDKPASFSNNNWVAADNMTINQSWSNASTSIKTGDALQRTITITGQNIPAEYLPVIEDPEAPTENSNYKIYVDKPELSNNIDNNVLKSSLTQKITYIPTKPGDLTLPSKTLSWWNNKTKSKTDIIIEGKKFNIIHVASTPNNSSPNTNTQNLMNNSHINAADNVEDEGNTTATNNTDLANLSDRIAKMSNQNTNRLFYILVGLISVLVIIILMLMVKLRQYKKHIDDKLHHHQHNMDNSELKSSGKQLKHELDKQIKNLKSYTINRDTHLVYKTIGKIAELLYPHHHNSTLTLKAALPEPAQADVDTLLEVIYSSKIINWDNIEFINTVIPAIGQQISTVIKQQSSRKQQRHNHRLPELYPE